MRTAGQRNDREVERLFHAGNPAYSETHGWFFDQVALFQKQLGNPKLHVTRQLLYEEYKARVPGWIWQSQFYFHLQQNLIAQKDCVAMLTETYNPQRSSWWILPVINWAMWTLRRVKSSRWRCLWFVCRIAITPMWYASHLKKQRTICLPSECVLSILRVPPILTPDNLKSAVISNDRHEPKAEQGFEDMGNHYHFVVLPFKAPTQKLLWKDLYDLQPHLR